MFTNQQTNIFGKSTTDSMANPSQRFQFTPTTDAFSRPSFESLATTTSTSPFFGVTSVSTSNVFNQGFGQTNTTSTFTFGTTVPQFGISSKPTTLFGSKDNPPVFATMPSTSTQMSKPDIKATSNLFLGKPLFGLTDSSLTTSSSLFGGNTVPTGTSQFSGSNQGFGQPLAPPTSTPFVFQKPTSAGNVTGNIPLAPVFGDSSRKDPPPTPSSTTLTFTTPATSTSSLGFKPAENKNVNVSKKLFDKPLFVSSTSAASLFGGKSQNLYTSSDFGKTNIFAKTMPSGKDEQKDLQQESPKSEGKRKDEEEADARESIRKTSSRKTEETSKDESDEKTEKRSHHKHTSKEQVDLKQKSRPIIHRPVITSGVFSKAIASVKSSRDKLKTTDLKSPKKETTKRRVSEEENEARLLSKEVKLPSDEIAKLTSLICKELPEEFNNREFLFKHFSKFGRVLKMYCNPKKSSATIHYHNHVAAAKAKSSGTVMEKGRKPVAIFWMQSASHRKKESPEIQSKKEDKKPKFSFKSRAWGEDDEIEQELRAMQGSSDLDAVELLERPKASSSKATKSGYKPAESSKDLKQSVKLSSTKLSSSTDSSSRSHKTSTTSKTSKQSRSANKTTKPEVSSLSTLDPEYLEALLKKQALTAGEKFAVLDARDKLLRQKQKKHSDFVAAKALVGTCRDMCPEKERYLREDRKQLHIFETKQGNGKNNEGLEVDHRAAVKEYSRSSADQEEPLPHELRPISSLSLTMDYLLCNIMDRMEQKLESTAEWYDFLWNRTRAIRKDITQQHLCDLTSAALVEKCARFHIHCAERLCEEDMSCFDQKINNENLTKCLQTLKYFYHDLDLKNIHSPNEAEFRAYDVLLNLNEGDILRQVQQLRPEIRQSFEVRFALRVFSAVNSNNYVGFFKLVKEASYLTACILHRYFSQIRNAAINTMTRAYCRPNYRVQFPLKEMIQILGFENEEEASDFCNAYGLITDNGCAILDRNALIYPEILPEIIRAKRLIESKRNCSVGEVVNNGPLPPNPYPTYQPHSSFDAEHFLRKEAYEAKDQGFSTEGIPKDKAEVLSTAFTEPSQTTEKVQDTAALVNEAIKEISREIILKSLEEMSKEVCSDVHSAMKILSSFENDFCSAILEENCNNFICDVSTEVIQEAKAQELRKRKEAEEAEQLRREIKNKSVDYIQAEILNEVVSSEIRGIAVAEIQALEDERTKQLLDSCTLDYTNEMLEEILNEETDSVIQDVYKTDVLMRIEKLKRISARLRFLKASRYFHKWCRLVLLRKQSAQAAEEFPCIPGILQTSQKEFTDDGLDSSLPMERVEQQLKLQKLFDVNTCYKNLRKHIALQPIDIHLVFQDNVKEMLRQRNVLSTNKRMYWKLIVSFSDNDNMPFVNEWIAAKLTKGKKHAKKDKIQLLSFYSVDLEDAKSKLQLSVCIKRVDGIVNSSKLLYYPNRPLLGIGGILFVLYAPPSSYEEAKVFWEMTKERLSQLLYSKPPQPSLPLFILLVGWSRNAFCASNGIDELHLNVHIQNQLISVYTIQELPIEVEEPIASLQILDALKYLAQLMPQTPNLKRSSLREFVEDITHKFFTVPAFENLGERINLGLLHHAPNILIKLFNYTLEFASKVATNPDLQKLSWPVVEFSGSSSHKYLPLSNWNEVDYLDYIKDEITTLQLPLYENWPGDTWESVCEGIHQYVNAIAVPDVDNTALLSRVNQSLEKTLSVFQKQCRQRSGLRNCEPVMENVPWTDVIQSCVDYMFLTLNETALDVSMKGEEWNVVIFYFESDLKEFTFPKEWCEALRESQMHRTPHLDQTITKAAIKRKQSADFMVSKRLSYDVPMSYDAPVSDLDIAVKKLLTRIADEKKSSNSLTKRLHHFIEPEESTNELHPIFDPSKIEETPSTKRLRSLSLPHLPLYIDTKTSPLKPFGAASLNETLAELKLVIDNEKYQNKILQQRLDLLANSFAFSEL